MNKLQATATSGNQFIYKLNKVLRHNETVLALSIIALSIIIGSINNAFFTIDTLYETLKAGVVLGIVAIGVGLVMINGGVDLSCMSIAMFSAYSATKLMLVINPDAPIIVLFLLASVIGAILGFLNALFISYFNIPIFIATLCTGAIYKGVMLEFIGNIYITPAQMPQSALDFSRTTILDGMHISVPIMLGLLLVTHLLLKFTVTGRGVFALGGAPESTARIGYNVPKLNFTIYIYAGIMYAIGGVVYVCNSRLADPYDMIGTEMSIISAVVLGGVSLMGGKGSILGILLGTLLSVLIKNNLILIGISSDWSNFVFSLIFVVAIALQAYNQFRTQKIKV